MILLKEHQYEEGRQILHDIVENESRAEMKCDFMTLNKMLSSKLILAHRPHPAGGIEIIAAFGRTSRMSDVVFTVTPSGYEFLYENE